MRHIHICAMLGRRGCDARSALNATCLDGCMDYARIVREAWQMAWRHRSLWFIGLFAGAQTAGFSLGNGGQGGNGESFQQGIQEIQKGLAGASVDTRQITSALSEYMGIIVIVFTLISLVVFILLAISVVAQGGMVTATLELALGRRSSFGQAVSGGFRYFWRFTGLALIALLIGMILGLPLLIMIGYGAWQILSRNDFSFINGSTIGFGLLLVLGGLLLGIVMSVVIPFAQRAIVIQNVGATAAFGIGWRLFRGRLGTSLMLWIVNLAVSIGIGIGIAIVIVLGLIVLAIPAVIFWSMYQTGVPTIIYGVIAGVIAFLVMLAMAGLANAFAWSYWTLAYLERTQEPALAAPSTLLDPPSTLEPSAV
jgi:hypothetical protein